MVHRSICLLIQQSLPVMVYGKEPVTVTYKGGTNTDHAPPIDHYSMVSSVMSRLWWTGIYSFQVQFIAQMERSFTNQTWSKVAHWPCLSLKITIYLSCFVYCRSICLLIQAALPCLLFANGPTRLLLKGGTNAEMAPQIDYLTWVSDTNMLRRQN